MYVLSFETFMGMRCVQSHQALLSAKLLVEFQPEKEMGDCIFVSHQWTGDCHPDVDFEQLRVLQRAFDRMLGGQAVLKSSQVSYAFLGRGEYILTSEWSEKSLFIWYDYFSCPQLVARSNDQDSLAELQSAVDSISYYIQASKYFVVMAPHVRHVDTGYLLSRETWQSRGWCRFERVCRELLCNNPNIAVIESAQHWYVMTPFDSWLHPACMGHFSVEEDRDKVQHQISGLMRAKLVSCLENSQLHQYRMVLNMQHIYTRKHVIVSDVPVMVPNLPRCRSTRELYVSESALQQLDDFLKENGFESPTDRQFGWSPACFAALRGDTQVLNQLLAMKVSVNDKVKADEKDLNINKGSSLLHICAQFCNNVAVSFLIQQRADLKAVCKLGSNPLHRAAMGNNAVGVKLLVQAQCNPHCISKLGHNPLPVACAFGCCESIAALLDVPNIDINGALHLALVGEGAPVEVLLSLMSVVNINEQLRFPRQKRLQFQVMARLIRLADKGHGSYVSFFLTNVIEATPLICCMLGRSFHAAAVLIAAGADVHLTNYEGRSALELAQSVMAPDFILQGLRGNPEPCLERIDPRIAEKIWISI